MSLIVSDRATEKQIETLRKLEYYGDLNLSVAQAAQLLDELFEQRRLDQQMEADWQGDNYEQFKENI